MRTRKKNFIYQSQSIKADFVILTLVVVLCLFGIMMIYNASSVAAFADFGDKYYYLKEQAKWLFVGSIGLIIASFVDYKVWYKLSPAGIGITILLLFIVFIPGLSISAYGARRWINMGFFVLQPAEFTKLTLIMYLSAWLTKKEKGKLLQFLALIGVVIGLILLEPDLGTAMIVGVVAIVLYFISGAPLTHLLFLLPAGLVGVAIAAIFSPYRIQRLLTYLDPARDPLGASYHIQQVLLALGSGGLFGLGLGKSRQKYSYLPEATTDSIFAIIGEEIGFVGSVIFLALYAFFLYRCFRIASNAPDKFGYLLGMGIVAWLSVQFLINLSAMTVVLPLTGVPLPFISYGGSGLIVALFSIGILLNISKQTVVKK